jgi:type VI secretion system protein ImpB
MAESKQHWLDRNRPPRVQITYDVEIGDAIVKKELPFIVGIMADLSGKANGKPVPNPKSLRERKFVEIDRDNFNAVLAAVNPNLTGLVPNKLNGSDKSSLNIQLQFKNMDDFTPVQIIKNLADANDPSAKPLLKLFEARQRLADLLTKLDGNDNLDAALQKILQETDDAKKQLADIKAEADAIAKVKADVAAKAAGKTDAAPAADPAKPAKGTKPAADPTTDPGAAPDPGKGGTK